MKWVTPSILNPSMDSRFFPLQKTPKIVLALVQNSLIFHPKPTRFLLKTAPTVAQIAIALKPNFQPCGKKN